MATVEDILMVKGPDVIVASLSTTVQEATQLMVEAGVGSIIIKEGGKAIGIFTERDLLCRVVAVDKRPSATPLSAVMSSPIRSCRLADDIRTCGETLRKGHIRHLAVMENDVLVGLISLRDVLSAELAERQRELDVIKQGAAY